jgi:hypothetical protein
MAPPHWPRHPVFRIPLLVGWHCACLARIYADAERRLVHTWTGMPVAGRLGAQSGLLGLVSG